MPTFFAVLFIFSFQFSLFFFNISLTRQHQHCSLLFYYWFNTQYRTSGVAENVGKYLSGTERTSRSRRKTELILTVKIETRHPVGGSLGSEFSAIVIFAEL